MNKYKWSASSTDLWYGVWISCSFRTSFTENQVRAIPFQTEKKWHSFFLVLNPHVLNLLNSWFLVFLQLDSDQTSIMPRQDPEKVITQLNDGKYMAYLTQEKHWNRKIFDTLPEADAWVTERARIYRHSKDAFENRVSTFTPDRWRPGFSNKSQQKQLLRSNTAPGNYAFSQTSSAQQTSITFPQAEVCRFF